MISLTGRFGQYTFHEQKDRIGSGRKFNDIFKGSNAQNEPVIVKRLLPGLKNNEEAVKRFRNEFDLRVTHPNIISATDYFIDHDEHYMVRQWVDGKDLTHTLHRSAVKQSITTCIQVLHALEHLHAHKILHLDVQPKNIIIGNNGNVYLTDLGLARRTNDTGKRQPFNIYYSAPEQILNRQQLVDTTTDLFAVGMILLELITKSKFQSHPNPEILMNLVLASPVVNARNINEDLFAIIQKATSKPRFALPPTHYDLLQLDQLIETAQAARYADARSFIHDLQQLKPEILLPEKWWKLW